MEVIRADSNPDKDKKHYQAIISHFYSLGIQPDWWKLSPLSHNSWQASGKLIEQNDPHCRGILLLGLVSFQTTPKIYAGWCYSQSGAQNASYFISTIINPQSEQQSVYFKLSDDIDHRITFDDLTTAPLKVILSNRQ